MLRLAGFFVLVLVLSRVLGVLPIVGPIFARTGILGIWLTAILLSWLLSGYGQRALRMRRDRSELRRLLAVDNPHNHGKAGSQLLASGRPKRALEHLRRAAEGEPKSAEWAYRLGIACLKLRKYDEAARSLQRAVAIDEEHAYGAAQMRLSEALLALGEKEQALRAVEAVERNHGPSPESAYRRGVCLKALGRRAEAKAALREVKELAAKAAHYQRRSASGWVFRAFLAGLK